MGTQRNGETDVCATASTWSFIHPCAHTRAHYYSPACSSIVTRGHVTSAYACVQNPSHAPLKPCAAENTSSPSHFLTCLLRSLIRKGRVRSAYACAYSTLSTPCPTTTLRFNLLPHTTSLSLLVQHTCLFKSLIRKGRVRSAYACALPRGKPSEYQLMRQSTRGHSVIGLFRIVWLVFKKSESNMCV